MTGGSTIVEFWRDEPSETAAQADDILLLKQAVMDIEEDDPAAGSGDAWVKRVRIALTLVAVAWIGFAGWAMIASGDLRAGPSAFANAIATLLVPLTLLALTYLLLVRNSRSESRRYLDTARALRTEADLLELRLGRIATQLEAARQTMQDQAELLDSYGAAASSNMEASAELIASRAHASAERAEAAERAGAALMAQMDALIGTIPELEDRTGRMAAQIMDNGHALGDRIDTLEARLHALAELSDDARARTLSATKSLSSQLTQLQEATRSASEEVTGMAEIAAGRIDATAQTARQAMDRTRQDVDAQSAALTALVEAAQAGVATTSESVRVALVADLDRAQADLRERLDQAMTQVRETMAASDDGLSRRAETLTALVAAAQAGIGSASDHVMGVLARDMDVIEQELRQRMGGALDRAEEALTFTDSRLSAQAAALDALIARSRESLDAIGSDTVVGLTDSIGDVESRLHQINDMVEGQKALMTSLHAGLNDSIAGTENRFATLEETTLARSARMNDALTRLTAETQRIDSALTAGGLTADKLIGSAETLLVALDSSVRELDETYPAALDRFDARMEQSRALLGSATPELERLEAISQALAGRAEEAESLLRGQGSRLTEWLESTQSGLEANRQLVDRLRVALDGAHQDATRITEGAGPLLVTALLRVKDTADQAAERARQALSRAIPDAAQQLGDASEAAMQRALGDRVAEQIEQVAKVAEEAIKAAHQASERLTRQLLTIADTSATIEQRIAQAEQASEDRDRDHFARRSAALIESLNSTAIDVAKILSNDVTDTAWSAYLKGDRGVFTRRAVKLLDAGESREIALHYDDDAEFRDHVNRYIHDFESMLRIILSARDGNALGVAVLSSDMGKLYVALAQAIERLRQ
ncbi:hypothetical protein IL54_1359 [Sphingobium sp. ba1]|jgi:hypothetical protein|uniref:hypothetical protein n=1 Tax=Sphingobium sp. ba1 TaxID=1522072 RepID=UPI0005038DED|nr:hypothetical protein [Sphingobium sp. ba1]KFL45946.1 hypothetical protein IL54_1359 [Sphingobium sp. ba1]